MFRGESERQGFATAVTKQLVELQNANIQPADLAPDQETGIIKRALASQAGVAGPVNRRSLPTR